MTQEEEIDMLRKYQQMKKYLEALKAYRNEPTDAFTLDWLKRLDEEILRTECYVMMLGKNLGL